MAITRCMNCRAMLEGKEVEFCSACHKEFTPKKPRLVGITMPDGQVVRLTTGSDLRLEDIQSQFEDTNASPSIDRLSKYKGRD